MVRQKANGEAIKFDSTGHRLGHYEYRDGDRRSESFFFPSAGLMGLWVFYSLLLLAIRHVPVPAAAYYHAGGIPECKDYPHAISGYLGKNWVFY